MATATRAEPELLGHPTGLFNLFFSEMWERFSYYGMRALLVLYMIKGFLGYSDGNAYKIYGAYTMLVYMTPFFGGMLADRLLGARRAVLLGGMLMAAGHLLMGFESELPFFVALGLLIAGNGFFKPNISTMVGALYKDGDPRRDSGFTIFYIGINLGAAMAPLLCGYVGETYGWHHGFRLATIGMLVGLAVFYVPTRVAQVLILGGALVTALSMVGMQFLQATPLLLWLVNGFVALALAAAGIISFLALGRGGLPDGAGAPPDLAKLKAPIMGVPTEYAVYLGAALGVPVFAALVWSTLTVQIVPDAVLAGLEGDGAIAVVRELVSMASTPAGLLLVLTGLAAAIYLFVESVRAPKIERERLWVVMVMMIFSMLFWAFFEQAGSSINNFTDRNVDRVAEARVLQSSDVGQTIRLTMNQEQLGYRNGDQLITLDVLDKAKADGKVEVDWKVDADDVGMGVGGSEVPASTFQSANPIFILLFGLAFSAMWGWLGKRSLEPNTPIKFGLALLQLAAGFGVLWWASVNADARGMVGPIWLLLAYLLHTTGELCLSPVGLSMVTRLSPTRLVSTAMGAWFLATAFSNLLAAVVAVLTGVEHGGGGGGGVPVPAETVHVYGGVFGNVAIATLVATVAMFVLSPLLAYWAHPEAPHDVPASPGH